VPLSTRLHQTVLIIDDTSANRGRKGDRRICLTGNFAYCIQTAVDRCSFPAFVGPQVVSLKPNGKKQEERGLTN
jgi:hypothetical protein